MDSESTRCPCSMVKRCWSIASCCGRKCSVTLIRTKFREKLWSLWPRPGWEAQTSASLMCIVHSMANQSQTIGIPAFRYTRPASRLQSCLPQHNIRSTLSFRTNFYYNYKVSYRREIARHHPMHVTEIFWPWQGGMVERVKCSSHQVWLPYRAGV